MSSVPVTLRGIVYNGIGPVSPYDVGQEVTFVALLNLTGLSLGGGPVLPPGQPPTVPGYPPHPAFPIFGPGIPTLPVDPGFGRPPPVQVPPPPDNPSEPKPPPPEGGWGWHPDYGWGWFPMQGGKPQPPGKK